MLRSVDKNIGAGLAFFIMAADPVSLTSGPVGLMTGSLSSLIRKGVEDGLPALQGNRPINKVEPEPLNNSTPGLGSHIDVIA